MIFKNLFIVLALAAALCACGKSGKEADGGAGDASLLDAGKDAGQDQDAGGDSGFDANYPCPDPDAGFNEAKPGIQIVFTVGSITMMGQVMGIAAGIVWPSAREDFVVTDAGTSGPALDTCEVVSSTTPTPQCATKADCAPEQECVQDTDSNGSPIAGSEHCETPRTPMNVGPFTVDGFVGGPLTFNYNTSQSGSYTATSDGSLPAGSFTFDADYVLRGNGDPAQGLGRFGGTFHLPADMQITSPPIGQSPLGTPLIKIDPDKDLHLEWTGSNPQGTVTINMSSISSSITCLVKDDGAFDVPADLVALVSQGGIAFWHILELQRNGYGKLCGEGVTSSDVSYVISMIVNYARDTDAGVGDAGK